MNGVGADLMIPGMPAGGLSTLDDWNTFQKATATATPYITDSALKTNVPAVQRESIEGTLRKVTEDNADMKLLNALSRTPTGNVIHQWDTQDDIGGQIGNVFNSEVGSIPQSNISIKRYTINVKFLMKRCAVSAVVAASDTLFGPYKARENAGRLLELARGMNYACYYGDETVAPSMPNGIIKTLELYAPNRILNLDGETDANNVAKQMFAAYAVVAGVGSFGKITHYHTDYKTQNMIDQALFPIYRIGLDDRSTGKELDYGAPVGGIKTSFGVIKAEQDPFIDNPDISMPRIALQGSVPSDAPPAPTISVAPNAGVAGSGFTTGRNGLYWYVVAPINGNYTEGTPSSPASVTIAVGGAATLTITPNGTTPATGYAVYRSQLLAAATPAPALSQYRLVRRIPPQDLNNLATPTVWQDTGRYIPGSSKIFLLNRVPTSIGLVEFGPPQQFPLYPTDAAILPWAVIWFASPVLFIPKHHFVLDNILDPNATWKPFG